ncbi:alkaline phosphatase family protein [Mangrovibacterium diazotrophicum]|uniref:YVTN family beta-propeller protein n=1 Tax=Mangrovibacterium diazotrophicum TaxID=1261403 RepID=A0A419VX65_9BACT|nr:alkaline phosphatase family protein [Mangrovibacterium diazotrophicum]RKD87817.1 YVTN family beta-propeller protein [Mangrovibacterium diazotrophicum]
MNNRIFQLSIFIALALSVASCKPSGPKTDAEIAAHYAAYDDSTLNRSQLPVMMPYNRIIDPAGKVISFGDPALENHSLDLQPISGTNQYAVEDRYGIAILDADKTEIIARLAYKDAAETNGYMSTYSGIQVLKDGSTNRIFWSAAHKGSKRSKVFEASWDGKSLQITNSFDFEPEGESPLALPNELALNSENGKLYLYVVLNGNNMLKKVDVKSGKTVWSADTGVAPYGIFISNGSAYVTNWGGEMPVDTTRETAGVPYGKAYIDPKTGAIDNGNLSVFNLSDGKLVKNIGVGLHPNDITGTTDGKYIFVCNSNSDNVSVISTETMENIETIPVKIIALEHQLIGDSPNALALSPDNSRLYVANGMDNAIAVIKLNPETKSSAIEGFIPTEAYPGGLVVTDKQLVVTNLEGEGARINSLELDDPDDITEAIESGAFNSHHQKATISVIDLPDADELKDYTQKVKELMLDFRIELAKLAPRKDQPARPMPHRIGEPSVFKHVVYIIKENRTYDQVLGDMEKGDSEKSLCIFGDSVTPNQHQLARNFVLLDNYHASGKCSAEGHQWTDAAMVTDYVEKNVRAWFRSYPHVQEDALVYDQKGFIWNNAADHGKSVRIYGEASMPEVDKSLTWTDFYTMYQNGEIPKFRNTTTISRVEPMLSQNYPASDYLKIPDQFRADAFIKELKEYENLPGDQFPELSVMALSVDHTNGTRPGMPTPRAMVADNDLALGRIIEAISQSRFWENTVIFVTEDDSQAGWDHVSAYRTTGFVVSAYSQSGKVVSTNYNQTSMVRSIEQILGIPPMNLMDATALPMFECFSEKPNLEMYAALRNRIPLNEMNDDLSALNGKARLYAELSMRPEFDHIDAGNDDVLNRILWFSAKGEARYPVELVGPADDDDDD